MTTSDPTESTESTESTEPSELTQPTEPTEPTEPPGAIAPDVVEPPPPLADLASRARAEVGLLTRELAEIELLATQARTEAGRHEQKRAQAAERLQGLVAQQSPPAELVETTTQLVMLTRRASVMEAQVDVLEGKQKTLTRYMNALEGYASSLEGLAAGPQASATGPAPGGAAAGSEGVPEASLSRAILTAQEDLRRDIARAMHDGPAQSLTNIVLQAQIVERLLSRNPDAAGVELRQLVSMVQQTLEATKAFIFDVRPMVLDDLGLVPTLRRTARDRGRRAHVPIEFESLGPDRRLPMDLESGLFRILDEALGGYLAANPARVSMRLDWGERIEARVTAHREPPSVDADEPPPEPGDRRRQKGRGGKPDNAREEMPAALAAMIAERREDAARAAKAAEAISIPSSTWREIQQRAAMLGVRVEQSEDGRELRLLVDAPAEE